MKTALALPERPDRRRQELLARLAAAMRAAIRLTSK